MAVVGAYHVPKTSEISERAAKRPRCNWNILTVAQANPESPGSKAALGAGFDAASPEIRHRSASSPNY